MELTQATLDELFGIYDELDEIEARADTALKTAQTNAETKKAKIKRKDGKESIVNEKLLWDEVWNLGPECDAGKYLSKKYPDAFKLSAEHAAKAQQLKAFTIKNLGINSDRIKLRDVIKLTQAVVAFENKKK